MDEIQAAKTVQEMRRVAGEMSKLSIAVSELSAENGQQLLNASTMLEEWADDILDDLEAHK